VSPPPSDRMVWFAVLGGAVAWTIQFVINLGFTFAQCDQPIQRWALPVHGWEIGLSVVAAAVTVAAAAASLRIFLRTYRLDHVAEVEREGRGEAPPLGRINFLAMIGLTVNFLTLMIVVLTAIGAPLLPVCQQA